MRSLLFGALLLLAGSALAAEERAVLYLDGARIEQTLSARKGVATASLPPGMIAGSLRVDPLAGTVIDRVTIAAPPNVRDAQREERTLQIRRDSLDDRLAALAVKEEIFKAAAKAQSGKAPKRSKTNPDPLAAIRQGTDYAVAQLEAVYRSRRSAERELVAVNKRLAALAGDPAAVGSLARIDVHGGTSVRVSYLVRDRAWKPRYDLRFQGPGKAELVLRSDRGAAAVVATSVRAAAGAKEFPVAAVGVVTSLSCSVLREELSQSGQSVLRADLSCGLIGSLPAGIAACYYRGRYWGELPLPEMNPGVTLAVTCGAYEGAGDQLPAPNVQ